MLNRRKDKVNELKVRNSIKKFFEKMKAFDELPEELADDALKMAEEVNKAMDEEADVLEITKDEEEKPNVSIEDTIRKVLMECGLVKDAATSTLDTLEEKLEAEAEDECGEETVIEDEMNEEEVTVDPEKINDSAAKLKFIREMKPLIASVKDAKTRKKMSDSLVAFVGGNVNADNTKYSKIRNVTKNNAKDAMNKNKVNAVDADFNYGMDIAKKFNPHYKEGN